MSDDGRYSSNVRHKEEANDTKHTDADITRSASSSTTGTSDQPQEGMRQNSLQRIQLRKQKVNAIDYIF